MIAKKHRNLSKAEKDAIESALKGLIEKHAEVVFAYVHGSFARGEEFSDIDIALYLGDIPASPLEYELSLEVECGEVIAHFPADVKVLNAAPLSFRYHVIKDGKLLIERDGEKRAGFQEATLADYFDFAPYRALYVKETLGLGV
jgi:predicted nucleotidyltransferase